MGLRMRWLTRHEALLLSRIRRMMGREVRAGLESGDVLQNVYAAALLEKRAGRLEERNLLPWMTEVARHEIIDEVRRRREQQLESPGAQPAPQDGSSVTACLADDETRRELGRAMAALAEERQRVLQLRCEQGLSWSEIADASGRSEEAMRKLYHRAVLELGQEIARRRVREPSFCR